MGKFFGSWALWQKLTFVLGCAIIVTILLGCAKLFYTHRKLRKHTTVAEQEKTMLATLQRHLSQRRRRANSRENDVPFGIRAIESGIEVEGVWISRNNSDASLPIQSRDTSGSSSTWDHIPRKDFGTDVERQAANAEQPRNSTNSNSSAGIAASPRYYSARNSSSDRPPSSRNSRDESPDVNPATRQSKSRHPPLSYSRYSGNPALTRSGSAASTLSALEAIHRASGPIDPSVADDSFGSSSSNGPSDSAPISASAPGLLTHQAQAEVQPVTRPRKPSTDLDLMHTHRMSQAAETGQLTPRVRKPSHAGSEWNGGNGDNNSAASTPRSATFPDLTDYFAAPSRRRSPSPASSPSAGKSSSDPMTLPPIVRQSSLPDVTPFTKFCQTGPGSPSHSRSSSTSTSTSSRSPSKDVLHPRTLSAPTTTIQPSLIPTTTISPTTTTVASAELATIPNSTTTSAPPPRPSSFEKRPSAAVVRGHGTGFEILRPGTLPKAQNPPVSLQNARHGRDQQGISGGGGDWSGSEGGSGRSSRSSSVEGTGGRRKLVKKKGRVSRAGSEDGKVKVKGIIDDF